MQGPHGIVNGHWEPSARHSRLLELVRSSLAKLVKKSEPQAARSREDEADREPKSGKHPIAAE
jgi:hypothetical protein